MSTTRKIEGEQKPLPPLVSDEYLRSHTPISEDWPDGPRAPVTPTEVRNLYEADRQRTREVVQSLVDALKDAETTAVACREILPYAMDRPEQKWNKAVQEVIGINLGNIEQIAAALSLAKSQLQIEPNP